MGVAEVMVAMVLREDVVWMEWMQLDTLVDLMVDQELLVEMEEMQPMVLMAEPEDLYKLLFLKPTWIFYQCLVQSLLMEVLEVVLEEMDAEDMVALEDAVVAPTHIALQELSIILIIMDIVKQDIILIGTQIQVVSLDPTVQMDILVMLKSSLVEMEQEDPLSTLLNILLGQSNIKKDMMSSFLTSLLTFQRKMKL